MVAAYVVPSSRLATQEFRKHHCETCGKQHGRECSCLPTLYDIATSTTPQPAQLFQLVAVMSVPVAVSSTAPMAEPCICIIAVVASRLLKIVRFFAGRSVLRGLKTYIYQPIRSNCGAQAAGLLQTRSEKWWCGAGSCLIFRIMHACRPVHPICGGITIKKKKRGSWMIP